MGVVPEWGEGGLRLRDVWRWLLAQALALLLWPCNWLFRRAGTRFSAVSARSESVRPSLRTLFDEGRRDECRQPQIYNVMTK